MSSPYGGHNPQEPPGAEAALQSFSDQLEEARLSLAACRDTELDAKSARDAAQRRWTLSEQYQALREARWTVKERQFWVDDQIADEQLAYDLAKTARQAASDHLNTLREQGSLQQSISKSVSMAYQNAGDRR